MNDQSLIGLKEDVAIRRIQREGLEYRITRRDKEHYAVTMDLRRGRLNLEIDNGKVTKVTSG